MCITPEAEAPKGGVTVDIQRLDNRFDDGGMQEYADGDYVLYSDHAAIVASLRKQVGERDYALQKADAIRRAAVDAIRSSRQDDIREAVRLAVDEAAGWRSPRAYIDSITTAVLSQMEKNNG